jgi:predicted amidophosphoribosyltransferase
MTSTLLDLLLPSSCIVCGKKPKPLCPGCRPEVRIKAVQGFSFPIRYAHKFEGAVASVISGYKDQQLTTLGKEIALSGLALFSELDFSQLSAVITPARNLRNFRKRGFDPAHDLAMRSLKLAGINVPVISLSNARSRLDQRGLDRAERARNVAGSMKLTRALSKPVVLFDDVMTTGATVREMARACEEQGVRIAHCCVLAQRFAKC